MDQTNHHLRRQIFIPILVSLCIMLVASIASIYMIQRLYVIDTIKSKVNGVEQLFPTLLEIESSQLSALIDKVEKDFKIQQAWLSRDKNSLLHATAPIFSELNAKYNITHFYFIDLEKVCYLRVHDPDRRGDYINRTTLDGAVREGKLYSGIELGPLGTFTLRAVYPWFIDGSLAGYLELGKEILHITPLIKQSLDVDLIFTIDKTRLNRPDWEAGMNMLGRESNWNLFPNSIVIDATYKKIPLKIGERLSLTHKYHSDDIIEISEKNTQLRAMMIPLTDAAATDVGDMIVVLDVTDLISHLKMITFSILAIFLFIGAILSIFIYFFIGRTEHTILTIQDKLVDEIKEHKSTADDLKLHHDNLEALVEEGTRELNKSLNNLQQEVDEKKIAEEALRLSEAQFRGVFEGSAVGITISDIKGNIIKSNAAYQEMLDYSENELENMNFSVITHSEDVAKHMGLYKELLEGKRDFMKLEKRYLAKDGQVVWGQLTVSLVHDRHGKPKFVIGLIENIGERILLENERIRASKLESIGILAGGIAHDFNNLLTAIIGNISLARNYIEPENKAVQRLQQAEKALQQTSELTNQLLTFAKGGDPIKTTVRITDIIKESASFALRGANVRCQFSFVDDLWRTEVDIGQFSQVIQNLVINADHAMPKGGTIIISAENYKSTSPGVLPLKKGKYIKISLMDSGQGIPHKHIPKIFDPYFSTKDDGSGLGLAIVHSVVNKHNGHIEVESKPGEGTAFHIYIPASLKKVRVQKTDQDKMYKGSGKILLMDDEEMIRDFAKDLLENLGYDIVLASDGEEAVRLFQTAQESGEPFDAVLMDITVPGGMGGKEAIEEILKIDPDVKAIVSSGYAKDPIMSNYKKYGFTGVVPKPYNAEEMSRELNRILAE
jgi:PAS domain S-box-containing protein